MNWCIIHKKRNIYFPSLPREFEEWFAFSFALSFSLFPFFSQNCFDHCFGFRLHPLERDVSILAFASPLCGNYYLLYFLFFFDLFLDSNFLLRCWAAWKKRKETVKKISCFRDRKKEKVKKEREKRERNLRQDERLVLLLFQIRFTPSLEKRWSLSLSLSLSSPLSLIEPAESHVVIRTCHVQHVLPSPTDSKWEGDGKEGREREKERDHLQSLFACHSSFRLESDDCVFVKKIFLFLLFFFLTFLISILLLLFLLLFLLPVESILNKESKKKRVCKSLTYVSAGLSFIPKESKWSGKWEKNTRKKREYERGRGE